MKNNKKNFGTAISKNSDVTLHFCIRLKDGSIADNSKNYNQPLNFKMNTGIFSEKFESELINMIAGEHKKIMLLPQDGFGEKHPAMIYEMPKGRFPADMELEIGLIIEFTQPDGKLAPGVIVDMSRLEVTIDFNHPLAGQVLLFEVDIISVNQKTEQVK